jgi:simple sugar transport system ATP-binding protein
VVGVCDPRHETPASLARMMIGADVGGVREHRADGAGGPVRLAVRGLTCAREDRHGVALDDVSFEVRSGEILAIAGVAGNGQAELFAHVSGERACARTDMVAICGTDAGQRGIAARRKMGAAFVPEERLGHAAAPRLTLSDNAILTGHGISRLTSGWRIDRGAALAAVDAVTKGFDVRKGRRDPEAASLSGGNLQKFVVGREILREPALLVVSQPTWGVDAGASATIRQALVDLARRGSAILIISQDLDEIFQIADRIAVIHDGRLSSCHPVAEMSAERLGLLMGGAAPAEAGAR